MGTKGRRVAREVTTRRVGIMKEVLWDCGRDDGRRKSGIGCDLSG